MRTIAVALSVGVAAGANCAAAEDYPLRPVRVIVPFSPGGPADAVLRIVAPGMSSLLGQTVVVDNRPGGAATIGMDAVAKAAPDGYIVGVANASFVTDPLLFTNKMPYDTDKDLQPVTLLNRSVKYHPQLPRAGLCLCHCLNINFLHACPRVT
jgi:tripartite-type tricarboxylate transporter receptor subunit TctC